MLMSALTLVELFLKKAGRNTLIITISLFSGWYGTQGRLSIKIEQMKTMVLGDVARQPRKFSGRVEIMNYNNVVIVINTPSHLFNCHHGYASVACIVLLNSLKFI